MSCLLFESRHFKSHCLICLCLNYFISVYVKIHSFYILIRSLFGWNVIRLLVQLPFMQEPPSPKPIMHIAYSLISAKFINYPPIFVLFRFLASPYFYHDAFIHVLEAPVFMSAFQTSNPGVSCATDNSLSMIQL